MISIIHPSRGRAEKSIKNIDVWERAHDGRSKIEIIISLDSGDDKLSEYIKAYKNYNVSLIINNNRSAVDAINNAAKVANGDIFMVVSDDTECFPLWNVSIEGEVRGKSDWILKTKDGIQDYIITNPIFDRAYYNRLLALQNGVYHPDFDHLFCDTYLTCQADILGRKLTSNLVFYHNHYSVNGTAPDELHIRNDATWRPGQETFIRLMNQFTLEERRRIKDQSMKNWLRNKGVQI